RQHGIRRPARNGSRTQPAKDAAPGPQRRRRLRPHRLDHHERPHRPTQRTVHSGHIPHPAVLRPGPPPRPLLILVPEPRPHLHRQHWLGRRKVQQPIPATLRLHQDHRPIPIVSTNSVKATLRNSKFLKVAFTNFTTQTPP